MNPTINWAVEWLQCYPQAEGEVDVVFNCGWRFNGVQVDGDKTYSGTVYSTQGVTYVAGSPYTPYADLTEEQVDRKSTRLNSSHVSESRMPSSA